MRQRCVLRRRKGRTAPSASQPRQSASCSRLRSVSLHAPHVQCARVRSAWRTPCRHHTNKQASDRTSPQPNSARAVWAGGVGQPLPKRTGAGPRRECCARTSTAPPWHATAGPSDDRPGYCRDEPNCTCGKRGLLSPCDISDGTGARPCDICSEAERAAPASAPGLGSPLPHLHRDWAHPSHICTGTGLTPPTSAPGLGSSAHRRPGPAVRAHSPRELFGVGGLRIGEQPPDAARRAVGSSDGVDERLAHRGERGVVDRRGRELAWHRVRSAEKVRE